MASKRRQRRRQCQGKTRHPSAGAAHFAKTLIEKNRGVIVGAYHCRFCGGWHIGHNMVMSRGHHHVFLRSRPKS